MGKKKDSVWSKISSVATLIASITAIVSIFYLIQQSKLNREFIQEQVNYIKYEKEKSIIDARPVLGVVSTGYMFLKNDHASNFVITLENIGHRPAHNTTTQTYFLLNINSDTSNIKAIKGATKVSANQIDKNSKDRALDFLAPHVKGQDYYIVIDLTYDDIYNSTSAQYKTRCYYKIPHYISISYGRESALFGVSTLEEKQRIDAILKSRFSI